MPLSEIKRTDIAPILDTMLDRPPTLLSAFRFLRTFLNWCVEPGYIEHAPTDRMKPPKSPPSRERVLAAEELIAIWRACPDDDYGRILKLLMLSGQRRDQWGAVRREYLRRDAITWPAEAMKAGKAHTLPLTPAMKALLPDRIGFLFPNSNSIRFTNWARCKDRLDSESGVIGWHLHDLRRTWATIAAEELDIQPHVIEATLVIRAEPKSHAHTIERDTRSRCAVLSMHSRSGYPAALTHRDLSQRRKAHRSIFSSLAIPGRIATALYNRGAVAMAGVLP